MLASFDFYNWVVFPLLIFFARVCDVSLGTLRGVFAAKGYKHIVPFFGFFEVLIWLLAIGQIFQNLNGNFIFYLAWAAGYATGSYIGLSIEERLAIGIQVVRIITNQDSELLISALKAENYGITVLDGQGARGPIKIIFTIVPRKNVKHVVSILNEHNPTSFYSVEDVKSSRNIVASGMGTGKMSFLKALFSKN
jgi:uncharacterized protein YebE (UPF0316 family)